MKKNLVLTISMVIAAILCFCGIVCAQDTSVILKYGESELFTKEDMDAAFEAVMAEFAGWEGCDMHYMEYAGDAQSQAELVYVQEDCEEPWDECLVFLSAFRSPKEAYAAWQADEEYVWNWILVRAEKGDWNLLTWGWPEGFIQSEQYTTDEMIAAVDVIQEELSTMEGVRLHVIRYLGDEFSKTQLEYLNSLERGEFDECAVFSVWFQSPKEAYGAWEADTLYRWTWFLARAEKGEWQSVTFGY